ncbi:MAG TPA: hypothetical protein VN256_08115 [Pyrinomonadaceae bacterium]|nr:hypothetical protein [Pyrinomonadaceae bacterium]
MSFKQNFKDNYVSFQGGIFLFKRTSAGARKGGWFIGNCPKGSLDLAVERRTHKESTSGGRLTDKTQTTTKKGRLKLTFEDIQKKNLQLAFAGNEQSISGSFSGGNYDTFETGLAAGDIVKLQHFNVSTLVIKDSAGSPATLVEGTDYKIHSAAHGIVEILNLGSYVQPFRAQYAYAATTVITGLEGSDDEEYYVYCALANTEQSPDQPIGIEIYRNVFDPVAALALINDEQGQLEMEAEVMRDATRADDTKYGAFFRWVYVGENL